MAEGTLGLGVGASRTRKQAFTSSRPDSLRRHGACFAATHFSLSSGPIGGDAVSAVSESRPGLSLFAVSAISALVAASPARAQTGPRDATAPAPNAPGSVKAKVDVIVLSLDVMVTDGKGQPVLDLGAGEFEIKVGGKKQALEFFEPPLKPDGTFSAEPVYLAGTTRPADGTSRVRNRVLFYIDVEELTRDAIRAAFDAIGEFLDARTGAWKISLAVHDGVAGMRLSDEESLERARDELEASKSAEMGENEVLAVASQVDRYTPRSRETRRVESRRRVEASIVREIVEAEAARPPDPRRVAEARGVLLNYLAAERQRVKRATEELALTLQRFAEGGERRHVVLMSGGSERSPGTNLLTFLERARESSRTGFARTPSSIGPLRTEGEAAVQTGPLRELDELQEWLASSGVTFHFFDTSSSLATFASADIGLIENARDLSGERLSRLEAPDRIAAATGGLVGAPRGGAGLPRFMESSRPSYRIGVRLQNVDVDKPYKVVVTTRRPRTKARHQSLFVAQAPKGAEPVSEVAREITRAEKAAVEARRDERRPSEARRELPPLPVRLDWKGKLQKDERQPGKNRYRVDVVVPYADLKFVTQGEDLVGSLRISVSALAVGAAPASAAPQEFSVDEVPMFTGAEYSAAQSRDLVRQVRLTLPPGKYELTVAAYDALEDRHGTARLSVVAEE